MTPTPNVVLSARYEMAEDSEYQDDRILLLLRNNDSEAASLLYHYHYGAIFHYTLKLVPDRDDAKDITQDLIVTIWQKRHVLNITKPVRKYLIAAARNRVLNYKRNYARDIAMLAEAVSRSGAAVSPLAADTFLKGHEIRNIVRKAINALPRRTRVIFTMNRSLGMTYKEIARHLGVSEKAVEKSMSKALALLRILLSGYR